MTLLPGLYACQISGSDASQLWETLLLSLERSLSWEVKMILADKRVWPAMVSSHLFEQSHWKRKESDVKSDDITEGLSPLSQAIKKLSRLKTDVGRSNPPTASRLPRGSDCPSFSLMPRSVQVPWDSATDEYNQQIEPARFAIHRHPIGTLPRGDALDLDLPSDLPILSGPFEYSHSRGYAPPPVGHVLNRLGLGTDGTIIVGMEPKNAEVLVKSLAADNRPRAQGAVRMETAGAQLPFVYDVSSLGKPTTMPRCDIWKTLAAGPEGDLPREEEEEEEDYVKGPSGLENNDEIVKIANSEHLITRGSVPLLHASPADPTLGLSAPGLLGRGGSMRPRCSSSALYWSLMLPLRNPFLDPQGLVCSLQVITEGIYGSICLFEAAPLIYKDLNKSLPSGILSALLPRLSQEGLLDMPEAAVSLFIGNPHTLTVYFKLLTEVLETVVDALHGYYNDALTDDQRKFAELLTSGSSQEWRYLDLHVSVEETTPIERRLVALVRILGSAIGGIFILQSSTMSVFTERPDRCLDASGDTLTNDGFEQTVVNSTLLHALGVFSLPLEDRSVPPPWREKPPKAESNADAPLPAPALPPVHVTIDPINRFRIPPVAVTVNDLDKQQVSFEAGGWANVSRLASPYQEGDGQQLWSLSMSAWISKFPDCPPPPAVHESLLAAGPLTARLVQSARFNEELPSNYSSVLHGAEAMRLVEISVKMSTLSERLLRDGKGKLFILFHHILIDLVSAFGRPIKQLHEYRDQKGGDLKGRGSLVVSAFSVYHSARLFAALSNSSPSPNGYLPVQGSTQNIPDLDYQPTEMAHSYYGTAVAIQEPPDVSCTQPSTTQSTTTARRSERVRKNTRVYPGMNHDVPSVDTAKKPSMKKNVGLHKIPRLYPPTFTHQVQGVPVPLKLKPIECHRLMTSDSYPTFSWEGFIIGHAMSMINFSEVYLSTHVRALLKLIVDGHVEDVRGLGAMESSPVVDSYIRDPFFTVRICDLFPDDLMIYDHRRPPPSQSPLCHPSLIKSCLRLDRSAVSSSFDRAHYVKSVINSIARHDVDPDEPVVLSDHVNAELPWWISSLLEVLLVWAPRYPQLFDTNTFREQAPTAHANSKTPSKFSLDIRLSFFYVALGLLVLEKQNSECEFSNHVSFDRNCEVLLCTLSVILAKENKVLLGWLTASLLDVTYESLRDSPSLVDSTHPIHLDPIISPILIKLLVKDLFLYLTNFVTVGIKRAHQEWTRSCERYSNLLGMAEDEFRTLTRLLDSELISFEPADLTSLSNDYVADQYVDDLDDENMKSRFSRRKYKQWKREKVERKRLRTLRKEEDSDELLLESESSSVSDEEGDEPTLAKQPDAVSPTTKEESLSSGVEQLSPESRSNMKTSPILVHTEDSIKLSLIETILARVHDPLPEAPPKTITISGSLHTALSILVYLVSSLSENGQVARTWIPFHLVEDIHMIANWSTDASGLMTSLARFLVDEK
eukprot:GHVH01008175.1.p1 GENE.GHVH01008175.1~~GHVH01008175.1.p1  ORF type:complete len:1644 (-),score=272.41 GHVH01008175.1:543-4952(-)